MTGPANRRGGPCISDANVWLFVAVLVLDDVIPPTSRAGSRALAQRGAEY
jgi:hypothetical protein